MSHERPWKEVERPIRYFSRSHGTTSHQRPFTSPTVKAAPPTPEPSILERKSVPPAAAGPRPEVKVIRHNAGGINSPDDPSYPFKLEGSFSFAGVFMDFTAVALYGNSEEIVIRAMSIEALEKVIQDKGFRSHPRLRRLTITGPDGVVETFPPSKPK